MEIPCIFSKYEGTCPTTCRSGSFRYAPSHQRVTSGKVPGRPIAQREPPSEPLPFGVRENTCKRLDLLLGTAQLCAVVTLAK